MAQLQTHYIILAVTLFAAPLVQMGCETQEPPSGTIGRITFARDYEGERLVMHRDPQAGWGRRFMARFYRILPIEGQL